MVQNLLAERRYFQTYPPRELDLTAEFLGQMLRFDLLPPGPLLCAALRCVIAALRSPEGSNMLRFGQKALNQFESRLSDFPGLLEELTRPSLRPENGSAVASASGQNSAAPRATAVSNNERRPVWGAAHLTGQTRLQRQTRVDGVRPRLTAPMPGGQWPCANYTGPYPWAPWHYHNASPSVATPLAVPHGSNANSAQGSVPVPPGSWATGPAANSSHGRLHHSERGRSEGKAQPRKTGRLLCPKDYVEVDWDSFVMVLTEEDLQEGQREVRIEDVRAQEEEEDLAKLRKVLQW